MANNQQVSAAFVDLTDALVSGYDVTDLLYRLVEHSVSLLNVDECGLLLTDQRGGLHVMASSSERTRLLELFQLQSHEGPCLDCYHSGEAINVPDLDQQTSRWPQFAPAALEQGYTAVHAVPLRLRGEVLGALNLFSTRRGPLDPSSLRLARGLADGASIAILYDQAAQRRDLVIEQLEGALTSRVVIEQAKGMLSATGNLSMDQAFTRLRDYARRTQARLSAVARDLAEGTLDPAVVLEQPPRQPTSAP